MAARDQRTHLQRFGERQRGMQVLLDEPRGVGEPIRGDLREKRVCRRFGTTGPRSRLAASLIADPGRVLDPARLQRDTAEVNQVTVPEDIRGDRAFGGVEPLEHVDSVSGATGRGVAEREIPWQWPIVVVMAIFATEGERALVYAHGRLEVADPIKKPARPCLGETSVPR
jgi:hypothetical protein